jgi:hypothetical protein
MHTRPRDPTESALVTLETATTPAPRAGPARRDGQLVAVRLVIATYGRHRSLRRLGQAGSPVGTLTPGTTGRIRLEGMLLENWIDTRTPPGSRQGAGQDVDAGADVESLK